MKNYFTHVLIVLLLVTGTIFAQDYTKILKEELLSSRSSNSINKQDLEGLTIYNQSTNRRSGVEHVYAVQKYNGIEVFNANIAAAFRGAKLIHIASRLQSGIATKVQNISPVLTPLQAATKAALALGAGSANFTVLKSISSQEVVLDKGGISLDDVPVKLVYDLTEDNGLRLAWDLNIHMINEPHWYSVRVDAVSGDVLSKNDWVVSCTFGDHSQKRSITHSTTDRLDNSFGFSKEIANEALAGAQYNVFALPLESPNVGPNQLITDPYDIDASPFGWHDNDGVEGADFTITRGNNAWAQDDLDGLFETVGESPDGGDDLIFDFEYNFAIDPVNMLDAVTTNVFYVNNVVHDVMYHYGFDEESGNFQDFNYSGLGFDEDSVFIDVQDGQTINNANFATPPDGGLPPRMQMYLWSPANPGTLTLAGGGLDGSYLGVPASFGASVPVSGAPPVEATLVLVEDDNSSNNSLDIYDGCDTIVNGADLNGNIAVIRSGGCPFGDKMLNAQNEGAIGVIVVNDTPSNPIVMTAEGSSGSQVTIPSIMVKQSDGETIIEAIKAGESINAAIARVVLPMLDSALDNGIVIHEYGHGIVARLTAGPFNTNCARNPDSGDEGWADYYGLMLTMTENDTAEAARGIANYADGQAAGGEGIRPRPYSTSFDVNNLTYAIVNNESEISMPHGIGSVWATMIWDMTWYLIDEYGFDADLYNGVAGNNIALQLVTDGLKLQPCNPGFVDSRDAIIAAIEINTMIPEDDKEVIKCGIWGAFARRGLGLDADQGSPFNRNDQVEDFESPTFVSEDNICEFPEEEVLSTDEFLENTFSIFPNPSKGQISINMRASLGKGQIQIIDLNGRLVFSQDSLLEGVLNINTGALSTGVYLLQVSNETILETEKLIIR